VIIAMMTSRPEAGEEEKYAFMSMAAPLLDNPRLYLSVQMVKEVQTHAALWELTMKDSDGERPPHGRRTRREGRANFGRRIQYSAKICLG
jgi:hypothetical protein